MGQSNRHDHRVVDLGAGGARQQGDARGHVEAAAAQRPGDADRGEKIGPPEVAFRLDPAGKRTDIVGADFGKLDKALGVTR